MQITKNGGAYKYEKFLKFDWASQLKRVIKYLIFGALKMTEFPNEIINYESLCRSQKLNYVCTAREVGIIFIKGNIKFETTSIISQFKVSPIIIQIKNIPIEFHLNKTSTPSFKYVAPNLGKIS